MAEERGNKVALHVYDLSMGLARTYAQMFIGKQIEGIWHTGIVVFGKEFYWGGEIQEDYPARTPYGTPVKTIDLGESFVPEEVFREFIQEVRPRYSVATYKLLSNNCNNFSQECSQFLTGQSIPADILNLPLDALDSPMGQMIRPFIEQMENQIKGNLAAQNLPFPGLNGPVNPAAHTPFLFPQNLFQGVQNPPQQPAAPSKPPSQPIVSPNVTTTKATQSKYPLLDAHAAPFLSEGADVTVAMTKFKEVYGLLGQEAAVVDALAKYLSDSTQSGAEAPQGTYTLFDRLTKETPVAKLFYCLFVFRLLVLKKAPNEYYAKQRSSLTYIFKNFISGNVPKTVHVMALTLATNMFASPAGAKFMVEEAENIIGGATALGSLQSSVPEIRKTASALVFNYSLYLPQDNAEASVDCVQNILDLFHKSPEDETILRMIYALGNFIRRGNPVAIEMIQAGFETPTVEAQLFQSPNAEIKAAAKEVEQLVQQVMTDEIHMVEQVGRSLLQQ